jgi:hypothetical protein
VSQITRGREMKTQRRVKREGVCDQAVVERARGRERAVAGVDSLEARLEGEGLGEGGEGERGVDWERVETIFFLLVSIGFGGGWVVWRLLCVEVEWLLTC